MVIILESMLEWHSWFRAPSKTDCFPQSSHLRKWHQVCDRLAIILDFCLSLPSHILTINKSCGLYLKNIISGVLELVHISWWELIFKLLVMLQAGLHHVGNLRQLTVGLFTRCELANATIWDLPHSRELIVKQETKLAGELGGLTMPKEHGTKREWREESRQSRTF